MSSASSAAEPPLTTHGILRWAAGSAVFELTSPDPAVLDRARVIFEPWLDGSASHPPRARFLVEADPGGTGARWRVVRDGCEAATAETLDLALAAVEYGAVADMLNPDSGIVALHAALLSRHGRGVLLVGPKEAGKSTLACALWCAGWRLHSDDSAVIEDGRRARGIPRRVSLRAASRQLLGDEMWERVCRLPATSRTAAGLRFHPAAAPGDALADVGIAAVLFLARRGSAAGPGKLEPLDAGSALLALGPYCHRPEPGIGGAIQALQPLADRVPMFDLGRGELAAMVARVEEAIAT